MPVLGIGGFFFRARDPEALKAWYREHLGVGGGIGTDESGKTNEYVWFHQGGPMVFEPFAERVAIPRGQRGPALDALLTRYAQRLEHYVRVAPYNWFNFHDFWARPVAGSITPP